MTKRERIMAAVEGRPVVPTSEQPEVDVAIISAGYVSAMRIPILRGREFTDSDVEGRPAREACLENRECTDRGDRSRLDVGRGIEPFRRREQCVDVAGEAMGGPDVPQMFSVEVLCPQPVRLLAGE